MQARYRAALRPELVNGGDKNRVILPFFQEENKLYLRALMKQAISPKSILIKQATIIDPSSPFNGKSADIFIENGKISRIGSLGDTHADQILDTPGLLVS